MKFRYFLLTIFLSFLAFLPSASFGMVGVNYKSLTNFTTDTLYWASIGLGKIPIRIHSPIVTNTAEMINLASSSKQFSDAGYYTISGGDQESGFDTSTATEIHDAFVTGAIYARDHGGVSAYAIGNEDEKLGINGYTGTQYRAFLRSLATDIKAVWPTSTIVYPVAGYCNDTNKGPDGWVLDGTLGNIDILGINTYGNIANGGNSITWCGESDIQEAINKFGVSHISITEFNCDANDSNWRSMPLALRSTFFRKEIGTFQRMKIDKIYIHQWRGYKDFDDFFAMKNRDGSLEFQWTNNFEPNPITVVHNFGS